MFKVGDKVICHNYSDTQSLCTIRKICSCYLCLKSDMNNKLYYMLENNLEKNEAYFGYRLKRCPDPNKQLEFDW